MPDSPALTWLRRHGNQRELCRLVEAKTGRKLDPGTVSRWSRGDKGMTAATEALVVLVSELTATDSICPTSETAGASRPS